MDLEETDLGGDSSATKPQGGHYFGRFGTLLLAVRGTLAKGAVYESVCSALRADSRISDFQQGEFRPDWSHFYRYYPPRIGRDESLLLSGNDSFPVFFFDSALYFQIRVPIRNQPLFRHRQDVPTDTYWVAWDGITALTIWERESSDTTPPRSAAHVAIDILTSAAEKAGHSLIRQACSPGCTNVFAHTDLLVDADLMDESVEFGPAESRLVQVNVGGASSPFETLAAIYQSLTKTTRLFAAFKNRARRLIDLENLARKYVGILLELDYLRIRAQSRSLRQRLTVRRSSNDSSRRTGHKAGELIAMLWLAMSSIEALKRDVYRDVERFRDAAVPGNRMLCFEVDLKDDEAISEAIDTDFIRAAVEQKSTRIDSRSVVIATLAGAVAAILGGMIGAGVSGFN